MKKYSSYIDLKLNKANPYDMKSPKANNSPTFRKALAIDLHSALINKDSILSPATTKYSAGYLQRKKIFSSKKEVKDSMKENQTLNLVDENAKDKNTVGKNGSKTNKNVKK